MTMDGNKKWIAEQIKTTSEAKFSPRNKSRLQKKEQKNWQQKNKKISARNKLGLQRRNKIVVR
jgi:hypothetical protein